MKRWFVALTIFFFAGFLIISEAAAQDRPSEDQKTAAALKENAELKRQYREELEKQNRLMKERVERLRQENNEMARSSDSASSESSARAEDKNSNDRVGSSAGDGNGADSSPAAMAGTQSSVNLSLTTARTSNIVGNVGTTAGINNALPTSPQGGNSPLNGNCFSLLSTAQTNITLAYAKCWLAKEVGRQNGIIIGRESEASFLATLFGQLANAGKIDKDEATKSFVLDAEASRTDKQIGADSKSSGTTSLAVKGGIPTVLGWAVENGAAVASTTGTSYTFRINPVGLAQALSSQGYITGFQENENDPMTKFLRKTSVGFTFDTTRGTNPPTLIGSKQQLSAVSFRYNFINHRDPRSKEYQNLWDKFFQNEAVVFTTKESDQLKALEDNDPVNPKFKNADLELWVENFNTAYAAQATSLSGPRLGDVTDKMVAFVDQQLGTLPMEKLAKDSSVSHALTGYIGAYDAYLKKKNEILKKVARGTLVTFEYTNFRNINAPDLSTFNFIAEKGIGESGNTDFTANASLTLYNKLPTGSKLQRLRDFDFSAQLDRKIPDVMGMGSATLTFAGKYQRLTTNAVAFDGTVLPLTKGDIAAGQIKLTIPIKDSGIKIPFSVTFANRTELVREKEVRGNFGFTFDLDTLFAKFNPFTQKK